MTTQQHHRLRDLIDTSSALRELVADPPALLAAINAQDRDRTNHELQTTLALVLALGAENAAMALGVLKGAGAVNPLLDAIYVKLCSTGIDFADALTQAMIDQVFTGDYAALAAPLKAMGVWQVSLSEQEFGAEATKDDVAAAIVLLTRRDLQRLVAERYNAVVEAVEAGEVESWDAAREAMGA